MGRRSGGGGRLGVESNSSQMQPGTGKAEKEALKGNISSKPPHDMNNSQINNELDRLDAINRKLDTALIAAGRGNEKPSETFKKADSLSNRYREVSDRKSRLRNEISRRYGSNIHRLPAR